MSSKKQDLIGLIKATQNYMRVSRNYFALQESQRHVEEHNYQSSREKLNFMINSIVDARVRTLLAPALKKGFSEFLDADFVDIIESKVKELMKKA